MTRTTGVVDGVLVVDKPAGMTSHDVVARVRRRFKVKRVGHAGTLDPDATGILVLGVGQATRLLSLSQAQSKRYRATAAFGTVTSTQDASGEVLETRPAAHLTEDDVRAPLGDLTGEIQQVPPMVSAVKVGGERLYQKARRGETVAREPRSVTVSRFELLRFSPGEQPVAEFDIECSAGTYIRTLVHDLGRALGCGAHMTSLRRTAAGGFTEADAVGLDELDESHVRPLLDLVAFVPRVEVDADVATAVSHGRALRSDSVGGSLPAQDELVALVHDSTLCALYRSERERLVPVRVLAR